MAAQTNSTGLVWFRRDLRLQDHAALARALEENARVHLVFVFDRDILDALHSRADRRVEFILESVREMDTALRRQGGGLIVLHERAVTAIPRLAETLDVGTVYANHDYEPAARARDEQVAQALTRADREFVTCKDQVIFERNEVLTAMGQPFSVFTPYKNAWLKRLTDNVLTPHECPLAGRLAPAPAGHVIPSLQALGFERTNLASLDIPAGETGAHALLERFLPRIGQYGQARDFPAIKGPSYLSVHLRFGTVSIRELVRRAWQVIRAEPADAEGARVWLSELIWREFYFQILFHHPHVVERSFKPAFDRIRWDEDNRLLQAWSAGQTGYPLVDAAMAQINQTGYMHNRLRMVAASFLVKDLGVDWRAGERYFAQHLNDFDLAANNGGWQWAASTGCDAQPWFRIFNPVTQSEKFDAQGRFIRRYVPALARLPDRWIHAPWRAPPLELEEAGVQIGRDYPAPLVDHDEARRATLARYAVVKDR